MLYSLRRPSRLLLVAAPLCVSCSCLLPLFAALPSIPPPPFLLQLVVVGSCQLDLSHQHARNNECKHIQSCTHSENYFESLLISRDNADRSKSVFSSPCISLNRPGESRSSRLSEFDSPNGTSVARTALLMTVPDIANPKVPPRLRTKFRKDVTTAICLRSTPACTAMSDGCRVFPSPMPASRPYPICFPKDGPSSVEIRPRPTAQTAQPIRRHSLYRPVLCTTSPDSVLNRATKESVFNAKSF
jgi:hypothetical protein